KSLVAGTEPQLRMPSERLADPTQRVPSGRSLGTNMSTRKGLQASPTPAVFNYPDTREMFVPGPYGSSAPLGASVDPSGGNFSLYSHKASHVELLLFDRVDDSIPPRVITLDPEKHRTYHYWHIFVPRLGPGQIYAYRVHGSFDPNNGLRFDPSKVLLDPYGRGIVVPQGYSRRAGERPGGNTDMAMKSVVVDASSYDREGDKPLRHPSSQTVIYEMHVRGFTQNPNSGIPADIRGTFRGLIEKIPYLQNLGITAVELLPIFQFDPQDCPA